MAFGVASSCVVVVVGVGRSCVARRGRVVAWSWRRGVGRSRCVVVGLVASLVASSFAWSSRRVVVASRGGVRRGVARRQYVA
ncbi:hypothetical protein ACXZ9C_11890 [Streptococcus agalactiae]